MSAIVQNIICECPHNELLKFEERHYAKCQVDWTNQIQFNLYILFQGRKKQFMPEPQIKEISELCLDH